MILIFVLFFGLSIWTLSLFATKAYLLLIIWNSLPIVNSEKMEIILLLGPDSSLTMNNVQLFNFSIFGESNVNFVNYIGKDEQKRLFTEL